MTNTYIDLDEIKKLYPDEWILLGNPEMENTAVLGGVVLYHSKDKKEVCNIRRDKTADYNTVEISFAGDMKQLRKIGLLKRK